MGSIWEGLGTLWSVLGHFWAHFDCLLDVRNHIFLKQWSKTGSKRPFGWLLDRFWEGLGRIWMRLGRIWAFKIKAFASHGHFLNTLGVPCCLTLRYKNPRAASLRLAERHNLKTLEILIFWLRKFWPEIGPNGPRTSPERIPTDPERTPNDPKIEMYLNRNVLKIAISLQP